MGDGKLNIAVRFFGGAGNYTDVLEQLCKYVLAETPSEAAVIDWIKSNTRATSDDGIRSRLAFLERIELLEIEPDQVRLTQRGMEWLSETDSRVLYEQLSAHVRGFDTILETLLDGPKTDAELGDAITSEHPEFDWNDSSGPAQHRGWLQSLEYVERSDGVNSLTDRGRELARRRSSDYPALEHGEFYAQSELEAALDTSFGAYIKGINPRTDENGDLEFIVIKAREDGPYGDDLSEERFTYIGEGLPENGDQRRTSANNALIEQAEQSTVPVYFFYHPSDRDELRYEGLVDVIDAEYVSQNGRMVYEFTMERLDLAHPAEFETLAQSVTDEVDDDEPELTDDDADFTTVQRRVRSSAFQTAVKSAYEHRCAICGKSREAPDGTRDIEAAHIYPKRENGRDTVRNGLALCRLHHWAFDAGWLAISDDYRVLVADRPDLEGYEEFAALENESLRLPADEDKRPHAAFLAAHRDRHGFE